MPQGQGRGHHEPGLFRGQGHGGGRQTGTTDVGVKAQFPEGQDFMGRKHKQAEFRASGPASFSQEKGQVFKYLFRRLDIRRDEENRALELLKEPGQDIGPGPGSKALKMRLPGFL